MSFNTVKGHMMINFMCQLDRAKGCLDSWFLVVSVRVFLEEISI